MRFLRCVRLGRYETIRVRKIKLVLYPICGAVIVTAGWQLWKMMCSMQHTEELYAELTEVREENAGSVEEMMANPWLLELQEENPEVAGWIRIPDTRIDYPVMQTEEDNDYYLNHDFNRESNAHGAPFLDVNCRIGESENLIIYGHNMKDKTMFQNLMLYKDAQFCESNGTIEFDTPEKSMYYQVIFVMLLSAEETEEFPYYQYIDLSDADRYQEFLEMCAQYAIWERDGWQSQGQQAAEQSSGICDTLLTLSTCEYTRKDGRLVVVAVNTRE